ncbi:hypothetical protein BCR44DRAFT_1424132 [Catenaria anguillulae PL171]|uniref:Uncharacterized protein n=1 Tax=Catenaria anguillulae PL171 TaxID=765915 RepID=A0A1Y2I278_9FUNG|nr:hypothetical protein BCR44DRAFT_1424132 [Catenaria anguillulae PL171]
MMAWTMTMPLTFLKNLTITTRALPIFPPVATMVAMIVQQRQTTFSSHFFPHPSPRLLHPMSTRPTVPHGQRPPQLHQNLPPQPPQLSHSSNRPHRLFAAPAFLPHHHLKSPNRHSHSIPATNPHLHAVQFRHSEVPQPLHMTMPIFHQAQIKQWRSCLALHHHPGHLLRPSAHLRCAECANPRTPTTSIKTMMETKLCHGGDQRCAERTFCPPIPHLTNHCSGQSLLYLVWFSCTR